VAHFFSSFFIYLLKNKNYNKNFLFVNKGKFIIFKNFRGIKVSLFFLPSNLTLISNGRRIIGKNRKFNTPK
jgi:hypothetical protein